MISTMIYAMSFQFGVIPVYRNVKVSIVRKNLKVTQRSMVMVTVILMCTCTFGYLSVPYNTPGIIMFRNWQNVFDHDYFMFFGKIGVFFTLIAIYPTHFNGFRLTIFKIFTGKIEFTNLMSFIVSLFLVCLSATVAVFYNTVINYFSIVGGFIAVLLFYLTPFCFFLRNQKTLLRFEAIMIILLGLVIVVTGWTGGFVTILN